MKNFLITLGIVVLICAFAFFIWLSLHESEMSSDFQPTGSPDSIYDSQNTYEGAQGKRILSAISYDGINYIQNNGWISDQAYKPDAVIDSNGRIYLYYSGWVVGDTIDRSAVAISDNNGETWIYKYLNIEGGEELTSPKSVDVLILEDGIFKMFYTAKNTGMQVGIHTAHSVDGINFIYDGLTFAPRNLQAKDSTTFKIGDTWHMYALSEDAQYPLWHLTSKDCTSFDVYARTSFPMDDEFVSADDGIWIGDEFHLFVSSQKTKNIHSWFTKNGFDWYPDDNARLEHKNDFEYVEDPTVVPISKNRFLMFFVADIMQEKTTKP